MQGRRDCLNAESTEEREPRLQLMRTLKHECRATDSNEERERPDYGK